MMNLIMTHSQYVFRLSIQVQTNKAGVAKIWL